jgi:hypothetical protein
VFVVEGEVRVKKKSTVDSRKLKETKEKLHWAEVLLVPLAFVVEIEERFLSPQADAFAGSEREEKASACSARNDRLLWARNHPSPLFSQECDSARFIRANDSRMSF